MENLYAKLSGKVAPVQNGSGTQQGNSAASGCRLKFVAMNAPARFEIVVNKSVFMIGKKDTNDGVITFNKMISRVHCKITSSRGNIGLQIYRVLMEHSLTMQDSSPINHTS